jgi:hypothetical protein
MILIDQQGDHVGTDLNKLQFHRTEAIMDISIGVTIMD